ncbi:MAG TPA: hypothetical protein DCS97_15680 [Planctomycetes bacterium]|nr:hypothetical protein [Planctomycetota bacterium]
MIPPSGKPEQVIESGLERMQTLQQRFKDDTPLPKPNASASVIESALRNMQAMQSRLQGIGDKVSVMA